MINYLLLALTTVAMSGQAIATKQYNKKSFSAPIIYTVMSALSALPVFIISSGFKLQFNLETLVYSVFFALAYAAALIGITLAISWGPLSISTLIQSYSLIIPTIYGIVFLDEPIKQTTVIGFILLVISLFAVNYVKGNKQSKITLKWIIAIIICFVGNGMCSTVQKIQQEASGGKYKSELMIMALIIVGITLFAVSLFTEKKSITPSVKGGWYWAVICGIFNGVVNLLVMILGGKIAVSILFPVITAGGIVLSSALAIFFYKEKLSKIQLIGVLIGIISIVFLNI